MFEQPTLFDVEPKPPANKTETSKAAARKLSRTARDEERLLIWLGLKTILTGGATDYEIQQAFNWTPDYERPRRWRWSNPKALPRLIVNSGRKRKTNTGNKAIVWVRV